MTLLQSSLDLYRNNSEILAAFVLMFIIIAPTILLCSYIWILGPLVLKGKRAKGPIGSVILFFKPLPGVWQKYF